MTTGTQIDERFTTDELAEKIGVSGGSVTRWATVGVQGIILPSTSVGATRRFLWSAYVAWQAQVDAAREAARQSRAAAPVEPVAHARLSDDGCPNEPPAKAT